MKTDPAKFRPQAKGIYRTNEIIAFIQFKGMDVAFRKEFGIPQEGYRAKEKAERLIWYDNLTDDRIRFEKYLAKLKEITEEMACNTEETDMVEEYLITGEPIISSVDFSRVRIEHNKGTKEASIWLRINDLSPEGLIGEAEKIKVFHEDAIKKDGWKPTRVWEDFVLHKRVHDLRKQGKSYKEIEKLLSRFVPTDTNLRKIFQRYQERMRKKTSKT